MLSKLFVYFVFALFSTSCAATEDNSSTDTPAINALAKGFGTTVDTIISSPGGDGDLFLKAAEEVLKTGRHIKIDGLCKSSCVIFADKARSNVCITTDAVFSFHMGTYLDNGERLPMPLSADIEEWVLKYGGFPYKGYLQMDAKQASAFWPMCK